MSFFCPSVEFKSLVLLEIAENDNCISSRGKTHKKKFRGPNLG